MCAIHWPKFLGIDTLVILHKLNSQTQQLELFASGCLILVTIEMGSCP